MFAQCAECHRPGEVAPFSLLSHADAAKRADFLHGSGAQPAKCRPWKAEGRHEPIPAESGALTDARSNCFEAWAKGGAPEGAADDLPPQPQFASGWRLGKPDLELMAPSTVYRAGRRA